MLQSPQEQDYKARKKLLKRRKKRFKFAYGICGLAMLLLPVRPESALALGLLLSLGLGNPAYRKTNKYAKFALQLSIIGLGFGISVNQVLNAGQDAFLLTFGSTLIILFLAFLLWKLFRIDNQTGLLIGAGTAICGGSAIAAVGPAIHAKKRKIALALANVFVFNSVALFCFPWLGHYFELTQTQFAYWAALAIHDTSSVVGACSQFGPEALELGTLVKLVRALWIVPLSFIVSWIANGGKGTRVPNFLFGFLIAVIVSTLLPSWQPAWDIATLAARRILVLALFFIGLGLSRDTLKKVGLKSFLYGLTLWLTVAFLSLYLILSLFP